MKWLPDATSIRRMSQNTPEIVAHRAGSRRKIRCPRILHGAFSAFASFERTGRSLSPEEITDMCYGMMMADRKHQRPLEKLDLNNRLVRGISRLVSHEGEEAEQAQEGRIVEQHVEDEGQPTEGQGGDQHPSRGMPPSGFRKGERLRRAHAVFLRSGRGRHGSARRNASQGPHRSRRLREVRLLDQEQGRMKPDLAQEVFAAQVEKIEKA